MTKPITPVDPEAGRAHSQKSARPRRAAGMHPYITRDVPSNHKFAALAASAEVLISPRDAHTLSSVVPHTDLLVRR